MRARGNLKRKISCLSQDYSTSEIESDSEDQISLSKKFIKSPCIDRDASLKNSSNSAGESSSSNKNTSDSENDQKTARSPKHKRILDKVCKIKVNPSTSIEISEVKLRKKNLVSNHQPRNGYVEYKIENKIIQSVHDQEQSRNTLKTQDSGLSSCQESSQEIALSKHFGKRSVERSCSSPKRFEELTESQESCEVQHDSDVEHSGKDEILTRVDEFMIQRKISDEQSLQASSQSKDNLESSIQNANNTVLGTCSFCMKNEKNGAVIHSNCLHLCCCYPCALYLYKKGRNCPICNCKIKNVKKLFAH